MTGAAVDYSVFISYRRKYPTSSAVVKRLHDALFVRGIGSYYDVEASRPSEAWRTLMHRAIATPALRVGVVLIERVWPDELGRRPDDVVLDEVTRLLDRRDSEVRAGRSRPLVIYPIYLYAPVDDPSGFPGPPRSADARVWRAYDELYELQALQANKFDHHDPIQAAADHIAEIVHQGADGNAVLGHPRPLHELVHQPDLLTRLRRDATRYDVGVPDLRSYAILGQSALLGHDFDEAVRRLSLAWRTAHQDFRKRCPELEPHLQRRVWLGHAANLLAVALLRGQRPRRVGMTGVSDIVREVLFPALTTQPVWPAVGGRVLDDEWGRHAAAVARITAELTLTVRDDYFLSKRVSVARVGYEQAAQKWAAAQGLIGHVEAYWPGQGRDEIDFIRRNYMSGLPERGPRASGRQIGGKAPTWP